MPGERLRIERTGSAPLAPDAQLVHALRRLRAGADLDEGFRFVETRLRPGLEAFFAACGSSAAEAASLAQKTLAKVCLGINGLARTEDFYSWLFPVARSIHAARGGGENPPPGPQCLSDERALAFERGGIAGSEQAAIRSHLGACAGCSRLARAAGEFVACLEGSVQPSGGTDCPHRTTRRQWIAFGAVAAFVLGGSVFLAADALRRRREGSARRSERLLDAARTRALEKDWKGAERLLEQLLILDPGHVEARNLREEVKRASGE